MANLFFLMEVAYGQVDSIRKYFNLCDAYYFEGKADSVKYYASLVKALSQTKNTAYYALRADYFLSNLLLRNDPDSAVASLQRLENQFQLEKDYKFLTSVSGSIGNYFGRIGDNKKSIAYYLKAKDYAHQYYSKNETDRYPKIQAVQQFNIGAAYFEMSDFEVALDHLLIALHIAESNQLMPIQLGSMIMMGNIHSKTGKPTEAEKSFTEAIKLAETLKDDHRKAVCYRNLGNLLLKKQDLVKNQDLVDQAKTYFQQALTISRNQNDHASISSSLSDIAGLELLQGHKSASLPLYVEALEQSFASKSKLTELKALCGLANSHMQNGTLTSSIEHALKAQTLAHQISNAEYLPDIYDILMQCYEQSGSLKELIEVQKKSLSLKDSIIQKTLTGKIIELQTKYETEKKQRAIDQLTIVNLKTTSDLRQQKLWLFLTVFGGLVALGGIYFFQRNKDLNQKRHVSDLKQRLLRAQLNPHFLFNSLSTIQKMYMEKQTDQANDYLADFAHLMREILNHSGKTSITLDEELAFIESYLSLEQRRSAGKFDFTIHVQESLATHEIMVPSFILQPILENAILHGIMPASKKGDISLTAGLNGQGQLKLTVQDNGVGYTAKKTKLTHHSKGMKLVTERLDSNSNFSIRELKNEEGSVTGTEVLLLLTI